MKRYKLTNMVFTQLLLRFIRSKLKLICSLSFWSHGVPNATVVGFNHMMPGVLVTNKFDTAFEDRPCQNFPHAIELHFFY
jgi:hypothetical protein